MLSFPCFCSSLTLSSFEELVAFQRALKDFVSSIDTVYSKQHEEFFIGFEGRWVKHAIYFGGKSKNSAVSAVQLEDYVSA